MTPIPLPTDPCFWRSCIVLAEQRASMLEILVIVVALAAVVGLLVGLSAWKREHFRRVRARYWASCSEHERRPQDAPGRVFSRIRGNAHVLLWQLGSRAGNVYLIYVSAVLTLGFKSSRVVPATRKEEEQGMTEHMQVATTIKAQIGINTLWSVGARDFVGGELGLNKRPGLMFRVGAARPFRKIIVTLEPSDTYRVELIRATSRDLSTFVADETHDMVYNDQLAEVVYKAVCK